MPVQSLIDYLEAGHPLAHFLDEFPSVTCEHAVVVFELAKHTQPQESAATDILGAAQFAWLERALRESRATWKVVACDMPLGVVVGDVRREGVPNFEAVANADPGAPLGRELEIARLLRQLNSRRIAPDAVAPGRRPGAHATRRSATLSLGFSVVRASARSG